MDQEAKQRVLLIIEIIFAIISLVVFAVWLFGTSNLPFWMVGLTVGLTYGANRARAAAKAGKM